MRCSAVAVGMEKLGGAEAGAEERNVACCGGAPTRAVGGDATGVGGGTTGVGGGVGALVGGICARESGGGVVAEGGRVGSGPLPGMTGVGATGAGGFDSDGGAAAIGGGTGATIGGGTGFCAVFSTAAGAPGSDFSESV